MANLETFAATEAMSASRVKILNNFKALNDDITSIAARVAKVEGYSYTLPVASATVLGGVKVGSGLSISADGLLSASGGSTADSTLAAVAKSGSYNDLNDKPVILDNAITHTMTITYEDGTTETINILGVS